MLIRLGIPTSFRKFTAVASSISAPILVSANAFRSGAGFRRIDPSIFSGCDVALDSAGFVAMVRYGGYPWSLAQYLALAARHRWAWWAAMDYCCEPQVAGNAEEVRRRVDATVGMLRACLTQAASIGLSSCLPVLQGWRPEDYLCCFEQMDPMDLPDLLGLGSVCRRHLGGRDGLLAIMAALDRHLPRRHKLHLFGVKGTAVGELAGHPRVHSIDSMAWDAAARRTKQDSFTLDHRITHMRSWYAANIVQLAQPQLRMAV